MEDLKDNFLFRLFSNNRFLLVFGAVLFSVAALPIIGQKFSFADPFIIFYLLLGFFVTGVFILKKSLNDYLIPYLLLQYVIVFIFFDKKYIGSFGPELKLYAMVFALGLLMCGYYVFKHFKYLWQNFLIFRLFWIFFLSNVVYFAIGYFSDFRLRGDDMYLIKKQMISLGFNSMAFSSFIRDFSDEAKFSIYIASLVPIVSIMVSLMSFYGIETREEIHKRLKFTVIFGLISFLLYYAGAIASIFLGLSVIMFDNGRLLGNFLGAASNMGYIYYISVYCLIFISYRLYLKIRSVDLGAFKHLMFLCDMIFYLTVFIILTHISKTNIIALLFGIFTIYFSLKIFDRNLINIKKIEINPFYKIIIFAFVAGGLILFFQKFDFDMYIWKLQERFTNLFTWNTRLIHWGAFMERWFSNLNIINLFFGFGLDSSMNVIYEISNSIGREPGLVQIHNTYLGTIFETGIFGILYFWGIFSTGYDSFKTLGISRADYFEKFFSAVNLGIIVFILIQWTTVEITMPAKIVLFCAIGFTESVKFAFKQIRIKEENEKIACQS
ncbi:MAG TPA: hypothetical protein P5556_03480 [Candidatus Gastranaerophilales bacterium]|nr:hypothetical protein [Candidatus Gastranaerophilales bacterium]